MTHFHQMKPPHDIHHWKAVHLSFPGARRKISFLRPVSRENFANALGQTCIHDLRLRLRDLGGGGVKKTPCMILILGLNSLKCVFCLQCSKNCTILIFEAILYSLLFQGRQRRDDRSLSARKPKTLQLTARRRSWFEQSVASDVSNSRVRLIQGVFLTPPPPKISKYKKI